MRLERAAVWPVIGKKNWPRRMLLCGKKGKTSPSFLRRRLARVEFGGGLIFQAKKAEQVQKCFKGFDVLELSVV